MDQTDHRSIPYYFNVINIEFSGLLLKHAVSTALAALSEVGLACNDVV